MRLAQQGTGNE